MSYRDLVYSNWKAVFALPADHPEKAQHMRIVRMLIKGNLNWLIRRLIGGVPSDDEEFIKKAIAEGHMNPPDEFIRRRREDLKRQNKQHLKH